MTIELNFRLNGQKVLILLHFCCFLYFHSFDSMTLFFQGMHILEVLSMLYSHLETFTHEESI